METFQQMENKQDFKGWGQMKFEVEEHSMSSQSVSWSIIWLLALVSVALGYFKATEFIMEITKRQKKSNRQK